MRAIELSSELRHGSGRFLSRRRGLTALSLATIGSMGLISLYQMGIIDHLPEPPLPMLNADEVDASAEAYAKLDMPDGVLGLRSYGTTLMLVAIGGEERAEARPWLPVLMAGKIAVDAVQGGKLSYDQWKDHRAFCSWCLLATGATLAMIPLAAPEAAEAVRRLAARASDDGAAALLEEARDEAMSLL